MASLTANPATAVNAAQAPPDWSGLPGGVLAQGDFQFASQTLGSGQTGNSMLLTYDLSALPDDAEIVGLQIDLTAGAGLGQGDISDVQLTFMWDGTAKGENKAALGAAWGDLGTRVLGGPTDMWSYAWTAAMLKSDTFKFRIRVQRSAALNNRSALVDSVPLTVWFTTPASGPVRRSMFLVPEDGEC